MNKRKIPGKLAIGCVLVVGIAMFTGCSDQQPQGKPSSSTVHNNLKFVRCQKDYSGGVVTIPVESNKEVLKRDDRVFFVCPGETLVWQGDGGGTFTVTFKNNEWPFSGSPTPLMPVSNNTTTAETVKPLSGTEYEHAYAYSIVVQTSSGNFPIDPHVIPIGN
jgi:hypothetical protein